MNRKEFILQGNSLIAGFILADFRKFTGFRNRKIRFGIISDLHYSDNDPHQNNNRYYRESLDKLEECVKLMNQEKVDFLIQLGDFKDQDNDHPDEAKTIRYLQTISKAFQKFRGPQYHVLGNHDHDSISKAQFLENVTIHGHKDPKTYYSFDQKGFHFIVLDGNYLSDGTPYDHGNFDWKDAFVPPEQISWLKSDLDSTKNPTIVFIHQRLDAPEGFEHYCVSNHEEINDILNASGKVILAMQGHYHPGDFTSNKNIHYYTIRGAITGSGLENNSFAIVEIDRNLKMNITGYHQARSESII